MIGGVRMDVASLLQAYRDGLDPADFFPHLVRCRDEGPEGIWITPFDLPKVMKYVDALKGFSPYSLPLYGVPFAIKDNIDLGGELTTAACPAYAYEAADDATVVRRLIRAGAIPLGKTNLDQFATGLNGTRSPYGVCRNSVNPAYVSGGSSSGSAVALALGQVSFSLGTDTAGSGRVPAAFNDLVGLKPTKGLLSTKGVVPACASLDCVSLFSLNASDAEYIFSVMLGVDEREDSERSLEPYGFDFGKSARFRFAVPEVTDFFGDQEYERLFGEAVDALVAMGGECTRIDFEPFLDAARLLYEGPWVAERFSVAGELIGKDPSAVLPVVRDIISQGEKYSAADTFSALSRLQHLKSLCDALMSHHDFVLVPTAPTIFTVEQMLEEPKARNSILGYYTNFMNLLDYAAIAMPAGFRGDGLPFGVTAFSFAHRDIPLLHLAGRWQTETQKSLRGRVVMSQENEAAVACPVPSGQIRVVVCGAHLEGLPLNHQLTDRGGRLIAKTRSAACYKLYALPGGPPFRPGMVRVAEDGASIEVEVWEMPLVHFGSFVAGIPAPLGIGTVLLEDGSTAQGFVCESVATTGAEDITSFGGWKKWLASRS